MTRIFDTDHLLALGKQHHNTYVNASPFPHIVIDNFMAEDLLSQALEAFPAADSLEFYEYKNALENKLAYDRIDDLDESIQCILRAMNSPVFLCFLENLTGIEGLIPDPYYRGGGIHQILPGGKLDMHVDFNKYTKLGLMRRTNAILYLNKDWKEEYGGYLELWKGHKNDQDHHVLESCEQRVLPIFNRLVVFNTTDAPYHGHPEPLTCPEGWSRKSLATYFYTSPTIKDLQTPPHSTIFVKRPSDVDDPALDELRKQRQKNRINTNVDSELTA